MGIEGRREVNHILMKGTINIDGSENRILVVIDFVIGRPDFMVFLVKVMH